MRQKLSAMTGISVPSWDGIRLFYDLHGIHLNYCRDILAKVADESHPLSLKIDQSFCGIASPSNRRLVGAYLSSVSVYRMRAELQAAFDKPMRDSLARVDTSYTIHRREQSWKTQQISNSSRLSVGVAKVPGDKEALIKSIMEEISSLSFGAVGVVGFNIRPSYSFKNKQIDASGPILFPFENIWRKC